MIRIPIAFAIVLLTTAASAQEIGQTESETRSIPILGDLPLLSNLFTRHHGTLWFPLETPHEGVPATEITPREQWLLEVIRREHPALAETVVVDRSTVRHDGETAVVQRERGLELRGAQAVLDAARPLLERLATLNRRLIAADIALLDLGPMDPAAPAPEIEVAAVDRLALEARLAVPLLPVIERGRLTVYNAQAATVSLQTKVPYVKEHQTPAAPAATPPPPLMDIVSEGLVFTVQPVIDPESGALRLRATAHSDVITRPIREFTSTMGAGTTTFQLPEVNTTRWTSKEITLKPGEDGIRIRGLLLRDPEAEETAPLRRIEIWCVLSRDDPARPTAGDGVVLNLDSKNRKLFVHFPEATVSNPVDDAPATVGVWRDGERVATATHEGGWIMEISDQDPRLNRIAIYAVTEGDGRIGDTVR